PYEDDAVTAKLTKFAIALFNKGCTETVEKDILSLAGASATDKVYWGGEDMFGSKLVLRQCYRDIWKKINSRRRKKFLVIGSPGIGKSWFLFYCMYKLASSGQAFVYLIYKGRDPEYYLFTREGVQKATRGPTREMSATFSDPNAFLLVDDRMPITS